MVRGGVCNMRRRVSKIVREGTLTKSEDENLRAVSGLQDAECCICRKNVKSSDQKRLSNKDG